MKIFISFSSELGLSWFERRKVAKKANAMLPRGRKLTTFGEWRHGIHVATTGIDDIYIFERDGDGLHYNMTDKTLPEMIADFVTNGFIGKEALAAQKRAELRNLRL